MKKESSSAAEEAPGYFDRRQSLGEILFGLNLYAHCLKEVEYSFLCLETVDLWLSEDYGKFDILDKKGIAHTLVIRGRRLFRGGQHLLFKGFLPEAEILMRSLWETVLVLRYILDDPTDTRAKEYINFGYTANWKFTKLTKEMLSKEAYKIYMELSRYAHPYNFGREKLFYKNRVAVGAIHDYEKAGDYLVMFSNYAVALCEVANFVFTASENWFRKHEEIYKTEIFKRNFEVTEEMYAEGNPVVTTLFGWFEKMRDQTSSGVG
jgi:hypothetical protein